MRSIRRLEAAEYADAPTHSPTCGTEIGYKRHHQVFGERACEDCKRAHSDYERRRYRARVGATS